jgi:replicative DNA helicase
MELYNIEAEKWLLSCIILDNNLILECWDINEKHFNDTINQKVFKSMLEIFEKWKEINPINLIDQKIDEKTVFDLWTFCLIPSQFNNYKEIVINKFKQRNFKKILQWELQNIDEWKDIWEILERVSKKIYELSISKEWIQSDIKDIIWNVYMSLDNYKNTFTKTLYNDLDKIIWWFQNWDLTLIAARPWIWKTAFALNLALNQAKNKKRVAFISLEMSKEQLWMRVMSVLSWVWLWNMINWNLDEDKYIRLTDWISNIWEYNIHIYEKVKSVMDIKIILKKQQIISWLDICYIDYLQLLSWSYKNNKVQEISEISRDLKLLSMELWIPIIALSQLNRKVEERPNKQPQLHDLKESWSLEQDASLVLMLYRDEYYDKFTDDKWKMDVYVRKNRHWPIWECKLIYNSSNMSIYNIIKKEW